MFPCKLFCYIRLLISIILPCSIAFCHFGVKKLKETFVITKINKTDKKSLCSPAASCRTASGSGGKLNVTIETPQFKHGDTVVTEAQLKCETLASCLSFPSVRRNILCLENRCQTVQSETKGAVQLQGRLISCQGHIGGNLVTQYNTDLFFFQAQHCVCSSSWWWQTLLLKLLYKLWHRDKGLLAPR